MSVNGPEDKPEAELPPSDLPPPGPASPPIEPSRVDAPARGPVAPPTAQTAPARMPREQLLAHGRSLCLDLPDDVDDDELLAAIEARNRLVHSLPRDRLAEIVQWAGRPVSSTADSFALAREVCRLSHAMKFAGLSTEAMRVLALLRNCELEPDDDRDSLKRKLKRQEGLFQKFRRKRRAFFGKVVAHIFGDVKGDGPEEQRPLTLRERIEQEGVVSGLKGRLRGAADEYIREKLDEIEARIDRKLDEIDRRLAEWRDREIANRLRIIRITLVASILVALLSLAYTYLKIKFPGWLP